MNVNGEMFVYRLETRDAVASCIIRECGERGKGGVTPTGKTGTCQPPIDALRKMDRTEVEKIYKELQATKGAAL